MQAMQCSSATVPPMQLALLRIQRCEQETDSLEAPSAEKAGFKPKFDTTRDASRQESRDRKETQTGEKKKQPL